MKRKRTDSNRLEPELDDSRLAGLPDDVLFSMASLLGTEEASKTIFALSRRFRNLWHSVPMLELASSSFYYSCSFVSFANKILSSHRRTTTIKTLVFDSRLSSNVRLFKRVARFVISRGVQHLTFLVRYGDRKYSLPNLSRSFSMLTTLTLQARLKITAPLSLPHATSLHLADVCFESANIFSSCPKLTDVTLVDFSLEFSIEKYTLIAPALEKLTIKLLRFFYNCVLDVSAPRLSCFSILSEPQVPLMFNGKLSCLKTVRMDFQGRLWYYGSHGKVKLLEDLNKMLKTLVHAEDITISDGAAKLLSEAIRLKFLEQSQFPNIKTLIFEATPYRHPQNPILMSGNVMTYFLRASPYARVAITPQPCISDFGTMRRALII